MVKALRNEVDLFICETMSSADEAFNAASQAVAHGNGKPVWVSWTLSESPGEGLRSGETVETAFNRVAELDISGFMFNCSQPEAIVAALHELRSLTDKPLGCYANRLSTVPKGWTLDGHVHSMRRAELDEALFVDYAKKCAEEGATIIGGCCGIGPSYIDSLTKSLAQTG